MKKGSKPLIGLSIILFVVAALLSLLYTGTRLSCEQLTKEKVIAAENLNAKRNWKVNLTARLQMLSSEERIVSIASLELGMIRRLEPQKTILVSSERIKIIDNALKAKYE